MPTVPFGSDIVVIVGGGGAITMLNALVTLCGGVPLSVTRTVKFEGPAAVGVPPIVAPLRPRPAGSVPCP